MIGRVVWMHGPQVRLHTEQGEIDGLLRGKMKYGNTGESTIAVGDYVEYTIPRARTAAVEKILKRKSSISRPAVEKKDFIQVLVSNVDRIVIVTSVKEPAFKPGLVDRFLVIAFKESIDPVIVLNKIDLEDPSREDPYLKAWRRLSCAIVMTSAKTGDGIDKLIPLLEKGTTVIAGHSGVGKSSLLNRINSSLQLKTQEISKYSGKGTHTTTGVTLYQIFPDGWVADTPGLKDFGLRGVDRKNLHFYFPEFAEFESDCQFDNCIHINEPTCAVKRALQSNDERIAQFRYNNYISIYNSLK